MPAPRVVVTDYGFPSLDQERAAAEKHGAVFEAFKCKTAEEVADAVAGAKVAVVQFAPLAERGLERLAPGAGVVRYGVGYDNIDVAAAARRKIPVGYVPDYCVDEVADHTAVLILTALRKVPALDKSVREGRWDAVGVMKPLPAFAKTTIGFAGLGRIGRGAMQRLRPFGFHFAASDPALGPKDARELDIELMELPQLFRQADVLSLNLPATPATIRMVNAGTLATMKPTAVIVNTSRGQLIDEAALARALSSGALGGAMLDVFTIEPLPADAPLRTAPNLTLTPHAAWYSEDAIVRLQRLVAEDIERILRGKAPRCPVPSA